MRFAPHTDQDVQEMLAACGLEAVDDLFAHLPPSVVLSRDLDIPEGVSELDLVRDMAALAAKNRHADEAVCFAGGGAYDHYVPAVVWALAGRSELYTSYTPYQPELSQGVLQALFEYQSMVCDLTALEVSNASLYDGATALVEAVHMALAATRRTRVLVSEAVDPRYWEALRTYGRGAGYEPESIRIAGGLTSVPVAVDDHVAAVVVQHPNVFGNLEPVRELFGAAASAGARAIQVFDPLSLGVLAPPGEVGADIAVAEGQGLGNHLGYGGPYLGIVAARMADVRRMPGRIVGETTDVEGRPGYVLTLQAREQHIRREKATSNICTNQGLMALASNIHMSLMGKKGLREVAEQSHAKAEYLKKKIAAVAGFRLPDSAATFNEFVVEAPVDAAPLLASLAERGILGGVPLSRWDDGGSPRAFLVAVTEMNTREEMDSLAAALADGTRA
jgi:glycine dehydrogenase subunit 1